jgi:hypothetical protein
MELRSTEREIGDLILMYQSLRSRKVISSHQSLTTSTERNRPDERVNNDGDGTLPCNMEAYLPPLTETISSNNNVDNVVVGPSESVSKTNTDENLTIVSPPSSTSASLPSSTITSTAGEFLQDLDRWSSHIRKESLAAKMNRFRQRTKEVDPITNNPRYGKQTLHRVQQIINAYDELYGIVLFLNIPDNDATQVSLTVTDRKENELLNTYTSTWIHALKHQAELETELEQSEQHRLESQRNEQNLLEMARKNAELHAKIQAERIAREREEEERRAQERAARDEERRRRLAAETAEREWLATILPRNQQSVQKQLTVLVEECKKDALDPVGVRMTALTALHTLFSQIVAHPEESNFRRVRRDHPRFMSEIGRHRGGAELLIAAGFHLGTVDEVQSYICTEPSVENDLDGWSNWYQLLKTTVGLIEEEMTKP